MPISCTGYATAERVDRPFAGLTASSQAADEMRAGSKWSVACGQWRVKAHPQFPDPPAGGDTCTCACGAAADAGGNPLGAAEFASSGTKSEGPGGFLSRPSAEPALSAAKGSGLARNARGWVGRGRRLYQHCHSEPLKGATPAPAPAAQLQAQVGIPDARQNSHPRAQRVKGLGDSSLALRRSLP